MGPRLARRWYWRQSLSIAGARVLARPPGLALLLAAIGLYGVMAQSVEQRTREIGVRMALGAERRNIFMLVIGRALVIAAVGIVVGAALSLLSMRFLDALLYQVKPNDPADTCRSGRRAAQHLPAGELCPRASRDPRRSVDEPARRLSGPRRD